MKRKSPPHPEARGAPIPCPVGPGSDPVSGSVEERQFLGTGRVRLVLVEREGRVVLAVVGAATLGGVYHGDFDIRWVNYIA